MWGFGCRQKIHTAAAYVYVQTRPLSFVPILATSPSRPAEHTGLASAAQISKPQHRRAGDNQREIPSILNLGRAAVLASPPARDLARSLALNHQAIELEEPTDKRLSLCPPSAVCG